MDQIINVLEARGNAHHVIALVRQKGDLLIGLGYELVHLAERGGNALLGYLKQHLLRFLNHFVHIIGGVVGQGVDPSGGEHQVAQNGLALHDLHMTLPTCERERVVGKFRQIGAPSHGLQLAHGLQGVGEGDGVHGNAAPDQILDTLEDDPMSGAEEVLGPNTHDHFFGHLVIENTSSQHRLLGLDILRKLRTGCDDALALRGLVLGGKRHKKLFLLGLLYCSVNLPAPLALYCFTGNKQAPTMGLRIEKGPRERGPLQGSIRKELTPRSRSPQPRRCRPRKPGRRSRWSREPGSQQSREPHQRPRRSQRTPHPCPRLRRSRSQCP